VYFSFVFCKLVFTKTLSIILAKGYANYNINIIENLNHIRAKLLIGNAISIAVM